MRIERCVDRLLCRATNFCCGSVVRVDGPLSGSDFQALRRAAGLRTLPNQNDRPETVAQSGYCPAIADAGLATESEQQLLDQLDGRGSDVEWHAVESLRQRVGAGLPGLLLGKYRSSRLAGPRSSCVYHATKYAQVSDDAVQLGLEALQDRSKVVRYRACGLLAYSQRRSLVERLRAYIDAVPDTSRADLLAAIDALEQGNHHLFVDRDRSGKITWNVSDA